MSSPTAAAPLALVTHQSNPQQSLPSKSQPPTNNLIANKKRKLMSTVKVSPRVDFVYCKIRECTGALGGNGSTDAIYGEITMGSMQKIINYMVEHCEFDKQSRFLDIGNICIYFYMYLYIYVCIYISIYIYIRVCIYL
jgi:hypothetical protein